MAITGALLSFLLVGVLCAASLSGEAKLLPTVSTPTLSVPQVKTPVLSTPSVTVPSVTVPSVTVPSVTVPSVKTPVGSTPSVTTPQVSTPAVTSGSSTSTTSGGSTNGSASSAGSTPDTGSSASSTQVITGRESAGSATSSRRGDAGAGMRTSARQQAAEDRRLRALVGRDVRCLRSLPIVQAWVLALRAGVGSWTPRSPEAVAQLLRMTVTRETRVETTALTSLRSDARGGCPSGAGGAVVVAGPDHLTSSAAWLPGSPAAAPDPATSAPAPSGSHASAKKSSSSRHAAAPRGVERADFDGHNSTPTVAILLLCLLATGTASAVALPAGRRRWLLRAAATNESLEVGKVRELPSGDHADEWLPPAAEAGAALAAGSTAERSDRWLPEGDEVSDRGELGSGSRGERWLPAGEAEPVSAEAEPEPVEPVELEPAPIETPTLLPAPVPRTTPTPSHPPLDRPSWIHSRASEGALLLTVAAGGARLVARAVARRSRGR